MKDVCCLLLAVLLMMTIVGCNGESGPGSDGGVDAYAGDVYLGEGPTTSPVTDGPVPPDLIPALDQSVAH